MKTLTEHKLELGEELSIKGERIVSFGIDNGTIYFWCVKDDTEKAETPEERYIVLGKTDDVPESFMHVATLVEGIEPRHIFVEQWKPEEGKQYAKVVTENAQDIIELPPESDADEVENSGKKQG